MSEISEQELAKIEARATAATLGPWAWDHSGVWTMHPDGAGGPVLDLREPDDPKDAIGRVGDSYPRGINSPSASMEFIAHAREDVPILIAEVRRQRDEISGLRAFQHSVHEALNRGDGAYRP